MPQYIKQLNPGDLYSGINFGNKVNTQIPSGAIISPSSYNQVLITNNTHPLLCMIDNGDIREMTSAEKLNVPISTINSYRQYKLDEINNKTEDLLSNGFEYPAGSGKFVGMEEHYGRDRTRWIGIMQAADKGSLSTITLSYKDDTDFTLVDIAEINTFWGQALTFELTITAGGRGLKDTLWSATTIAELEAVIDNR